MLGEIVSVLGVVSGLCAVLLIWVRVFNSTVVWAHLRFLELRLRFLVNRPRFSKSLVSAVFGDYIGENDVQAKRRRLKEFLFALETQVSEERGRVVLGWEYEFFIDQILRDFSEEIKRARPRDVAKRLREIAVSVYR